MNDMVQVLTTYGHPATTSQLYDLWWDWEVERRVQQDIADGGPGRRNKSPFHTPTRRELSGWLKRDGRFQNVNTSLRNTGKVALWVCTEGDV